MRAVWSFWHEPWAGYRADAWGSETSHLLSWVLSFELARRHYPTSSLVADDAGARILVDGLGLDFDTVSLALNDLRGCDPCWWSIGKLAAVAEQEEPFVHIDSDVFLWKALPARLVAAPVFAQNPEPFALGDYYKPEVFERALAGRRGAWLPEEWGWYATTSSTRGECCGIVGGTRPDFLRHWARQGLRLVTEPGNRSVLDALSDRPTLMVTLEQYLLTACFEHHRDTSGSPYRDVRMSYLFESWGDALDEDQAARVGFTHLITAKRDPEIVERLDRRVRRDYPERYERCLAVAADVDRAGVADERAGVEVGHPSGSEQPPSPGGKS
jgi:hypothetical protein